jgi:hypothetical protein
MMQYLAPLQHGSHEGRIVKIKEGEHANKVGVVAYSDNLGRFHTVKAINSRNGVSFGYHPTSNLLNAEKPLNEDDTPNIGDRVGTIRGRGTKGRIQNIASNGKGVETAFVKTDNGDIVPTPLTNIRMESTLQKVRRILAESMMLLEYNEEKNWARFGPKVSERMSAEGIPPEQHREALHNAIHSADPTHNKQYANWITDKYASGGINRLEDISSRVGPALSVYHKDAQEKTAQNVPVSKKIRDIKNIRELEDHAGVLGGTGSTENISTNDPRHESAMKLKAGENEHWEHFHLKADEATHPDSRYLAHHYKSEIKGDTSDPDHTRWCTAQNTDEAYHHHINDGDLHIFVPKTPRGRNERYQTHFESNQAMDKEDLPVSPQKVFADRPWPHSYQKVIDKHLEDVFSS